MEKVIIMGAAGRDFHNFNVYFRDNPSYQVVAFTATQIPGIENRIYPASLTGKLYPEGIPILPETDLTQIIKKHQVDQVVFAYSDTSHSHVMHIASQALSSGADFRILGPQHTMIQSKLPMVAITGVRTGSGKSQTSRYVGQLLMNSRKKATVIRHPMPYGNLENQKVQRFTTYGDMDHHHCTIEEREEYEPYIDMGMVVYAGLDYEKILRQAENESDVIIWDGGNNDFPFYYPDLHIVVVDPLRPGDETNYHPGETNLRMADVVVINKVNSAKPADVEAVKKSIAVYNPDSAVILANSRIDVEHPEMVRGKDVLVIEDGPTLTHGNMPYGAGLIAAKELEAKLIDPRPYAVGTISETFKKWGHLDKVLPAMGYSAAQIKELEQTINNTPADLVIIGTPINLSRFVNIKRPFIRVRYSLEEIVPQLEMFLKTMILSKC